MLTSQPSIFTPGLIASAVTKSLRWKKEGPDDRPYVLETLARPAGFEPTTPWFVARYSIQLSYGRAAAGIVAEARFPGQRDPVSREQTRPARGLSRFLGLLRSRRIDCQTPLAQHA